MKILAIESSCDETAVAILEVQNEELNLLSNVVFSQIDIHKKYGGLFPKLLAAIISKKLPMFWKKL